MPWQDHRLYSHSDPPAPLHLLVAQCRLADLVLHGPGLSFPTCKAQRAFPLVRVCSAGSKGTEDSISDVVPRSMDTLKGTSHRTNGFYPDLHSRRSHIPTSASKLRFRCQSRDRGLVLRTNQVHVNEFTVQTVEVKVRTGHSGFSAVGQSQRSPQADQTLQHTGGRVPQGGAPHPWLHSGPLPHYSTGSHSTCNLQQTCYHL